MPRAKGRNGSHQRAQCEGKNWKRSVEAFLSLNRQSLDAQRARERKLEEDAEAASQGKKKMKASGPDPFLGHNLERKLGIALECALNLAKLINRAIYNSAVLKSEPGCERCSDEQLNMENTSFLLSTLRKLPGCPGRADKGNEWMGKESMRFTAPHAPPLGSAPDAGHGAAPPADGPRGDAEHPVSDTRESEVCWRKSSALPRGSCAPAQAAPDLARRSQRTRQSSDQARRSHRAGQSSGKVCGRLAQVTYPL